MELRIEPDLKYCPRCLDEYRAEIERCASCACDLLTGNEILEQAVGKQADSAERTMDIAEGDELTAILQGQMLQLKQVQAMFERFRLPSIIVNEDGSNCKKGCCGPTVVLQVRTADLETAAQLLQQDHVRSTGLADHDHTHAGAVYDTRADEATCPACGFVFSTGNSACPDCGLHFS